MKTYRIVNTIEITIKANSIDEAQEIWGEVDIQMTDHNGDPVGFIFADCEVIEDVMPLPSVASH